VQELLALGRSLGEGEWGRGGGARALAPRKKAILLQCSSWPRRRQRGGASSE